MARFSITGEVHRHLKKVIGNGDIVIDATVGNGHDSQFLAEQVGASGHLYGFDIQPEALAATANLLATHHLSDRATLFLHSHATMKQKLPQKIDGHVRCIMFNLGYLPGGDKSLTTLPDSTLKALNQGLELLVPDGIISVLAYRGHPGGESECTSVMKWCNALPREQFTVSINNLLPEHLSTPLWIVIRKRASF